MPSIYKTFTSVLALAALVVAQDPNFDAINTPAKDANVPAGQPFTITWSLLSDDTPTGPVTIALIGGDSTTALVPISDIGREFLFFFFVSSISLALAPFRSFIFHSSLLPLCPLLLTPTPRRKQRRPHVCVGC